MKAEFKNMDEIGKRMLSPLRDVPTLDTQVAAEERKKFLLQGEIFRSAMQDPRHPENTVERAAGRRTFSLMKALVGALLALVILVGSSATVFASQSSLPGEPLYVIKSISEDIRMSMTTSPEARLKLTLTYTDRRISEIKTLMTKGKDLPDQASDRYNGELESALKLASGMNDPQMRQALGQIRNTAKSQGITLQALIEKMPEQADPAINRLQERLQEQIQLSDIGEADPISFREKMHARQHHKPGANLLTPTSTLPGNRLKDGTASPGNPGKGNQNNGNNGNQNPNPPGQNNQGNGTPEGGK